MANHAKVLTDIEFQHVLNVAKEHRYTERTRILLMLSHKAGMRVSEIASLKISDVVLPTGQITDQIRLRADQTKGAKARTVYVNDTLRAELDVYLRFAKLENDSALIPSQRGGHFSPNSLCQVFYHTFKRADLVGASSHSGRRKFITTLHNANVPMRHIQKLVGHNHLTTTQAYLDATDTDLRKAVMQA